jgi:hypothetical protein
MNHTEIGRHLSSIYETAFNTGISAMNCIQDYTEKMVNLSIEQSPWIPEENRKLILSWVETYRKGYDDLRGAMTERFKHFDSLLNMGGIGASFTDAVTEQVTHFNPLFNLQNIEESIAIPVKRLLKKAVKRTVKRKSRR